MALYYADDAIITTNPEVSSVRDSDRILGILASKSRRAERGEDPVTEHLVITRYNPERVQQQEMLSVEDIIEILSIKLLGVIPESETVLTASNQGEPVSPPARQPGRTGLLRPSRTLPRQGSATPFPRCQTQRHLFQNSLEAKA